MAITYNKICNRCNAPYESVNTLMQRCPACRIIEATEEAARAQPRSYSNYSTNTEPVIFEKKTASDHIADALPALLLWALVLFIMWPILGILF